MANAASCPGLTNVFTCVKRAAAVLKFTPGTTQHATEPTTSEAQRRASRLFAVRCVSFVGSLLGCAETLVDGLQNGIALFKAHVEKFCADAANKAICDKFQPIFNSAEMSLTNVADPDPAVSNPSFLRLFFVFCFELSFRVAFALNMAQFAG